MASASVLTLRGMVDAIIAIELPSTRRVYAAPPENLTTADLPAMWPELPSVASNGQAYVCEGMNANVTMDVVIAVEPYGQDSQEVRFDLAIKLGDELRSAVTTYGSGKTWDYSLWTDFEIDVSASVEVSSTGYWGIRATITARNEPS